MNRGEIREVDWRFSDWTGSKRRPAVVVQADFLEGLNGVLFARLPPAG